VFFKGGFREKITLWNAKASRILPYMTILCRQRPSAHWHL
jgi:hypothetical protein